MGNNRISLDEMAHFANYYQDLVDAGQIHQETAFYALCLELDIDAAKAYQEIGSANLFQLLGYAAWPTPTHLITEALLRNSSQE